MDGTDAEAGRVNGTDAEADAQQELADGSGASRRKELNMSMIC